MGGGLKETPHPHPSTKKKGWESWVLIKINNIKKCAVNHRGYIRVIKRQKVTFTFHVTRHFLLEEDCWAMGKMKLVPGQWARNARL